MEHNTVDAPPPPTRYDPDTMTRVVINATRRSPRSGALSSSMVTIGDEDDDEERSEMNNPMAFDDEDEEILGQLSTRICNRRGGNIFIRHWKKVALCSLVVALIVGGSVGITFAVKKGSHSPSSRDEEDGSTTVKGAVRLSPPPSKLQSACDHSNIVSTTGYATCEKLCEVSACCTLPPTSTQSCLLGNENDCGIYHVSCVNLYYDDLGKQSGKVEIPPAPPFLSTICSTTNIATHEGFHVCEQICDQAKCCTLNDGICEVSNRHECLMYDTYCNVLADVKDNVDGSVEIPLPPSDMNQICSTKDIATHDGYEICKSICDRSKCCNDLSCVVTNLEVCTAYQVCTNLDGVVPIAPTDLSIRCSPENLMSLDGFMLCHDTCIRAEKCCGAHDSTGTNNTTTTCTVVGEILLEEVCATYADCAILDGTHPASDTVREACSTTNLLTDIGMKECESVCEIAMCCFQDDDPNKSCYNDNNAVWCEQYAPCYQLVDGTMTMSDVVKPNTDLTLVKSIVNDACHTMQYGTPDGQRLCHALCQGYGCCFTEIMDENCRNERKSECEAHSGCPGYDLTNLIPVTPYNPADDVNLTKSVIGKSCTEENVKRDVGHHECYSLCQHHMCCFESNDGSSSYCRDTHPEECELHEPCSILLFPKNGTTTTTTTPATDNEDETQDTQTTIGPKSAQVPNTTQSDDVVSPTFKNTQSTTNKCPTDQTPNIGVTCTGNATNCPGGGVTDNRECCEKYDPKLGICTNVCSSSLLCNCVNNVWVCKPSHFCQLPDPDCVTT